MTSTNCENINRTGGCLSSLRSSSATFACLQQPSIPRKKTCRLGEVSRVRYGNQPNMSAHSKKTSLYSEQVEQTMYVTDLYIRWWILTNRRRRYKWRGRASDCCPLWRCIQGNRKRTPACRTDVRTTPTTRMASLSALHTPRLQATNRNQNLTRLDTSVHYQGHFV